jgi:hypothetical protein
MRIGELLLGQKKVRQSELARCVEEKASQPGRRLVSLLIRSGALEFDDGSRALGEQHGMPCVLAKHLAGRDPELTKLIPNELARALCALPIGRTKGALIVCVRDPGAQLKSQLETTVHGEVMLVISPAMRLEGLISDVYGPAPADEFDVSVDSQLELPPAPKPFAKLPPIPDMSSLDPESVRLALTDLDDARVTKDIAPHKISAAMMSVLPPSPTLPPPMHTPTLPPPTLPPPPPPPSVMAPGTLPPATRAASTPRPTLPPPPPTMAATSEALELAATRDDATEAVMRFVAGTWVSGAVLAIREDAAIGYRGHGDGLGKIETLIVPLLSPSTVQRAIETKRTSIQGADSKPQAELARRLGTTEPCAAPILVRGQVIAVIVVGNTIHGALGDTERSIAELGRLARMLGTAWERVLGTR